MPGVEAAGLLGEQVAVGVHHAGRLLHAVHAAVSVERPAGDAERERVEAVVFILPAFHPFAVGAELHTDGGGVGGGGVGAAADGLEAVGAFVEAVGRDAFELAVFGVDGVVEEVVVFGLG